MTMQAMVDYLTARGFEVEKKYDTKKQVYVFDITKNGRKLREEFKYPSEPSSSIRNIIQQAFLDDILKRFDTGLFDIPSAYPNSMIDTDAVKYAVQDAWNAHLMYQMHNMQKYGTGIPKNSIKKVIFNDPATIVLWSDGTKTVVKSQNNEKYDPEKGLAMAISKKALGNKGNYYNVFQKHLDEYEESRTFGEKLVEAMNEILKNPPRIQPLSESLNETREKARVKEKINQAIRVLALHRDSHQVLKSEMEVAINEALGYLKEALGE